MLPVNWSPAVIVKWCVVWFPLKTSTGVVNINTVTTVSQTTVPLVKGMMDFVILHSQTWVAFHQRSPLEDWLKFKSAMLKVPISSKSSVNPNNNVHFGVSFQISAFGKSVVKTNCGVLQVINFE